MRILNQFTSLRTSLLQTTTMDAKVLLSAVFRDPTKEGRSQFVKIWFLTSNLPDWLLPGVKIYPITKGVVSYTFRRLPPRDLTLTINTEKKTYQYLGGSGKAELKTFLQKAIDDPGYGVHGHMVIVQLDGPASHTMDRLKDKCDSVPGPNSGDGIMPLSGTPSGSLDSVPGPISGYGIMPLSGTPSGSLDRVKDKCDSVPGPNSGDGIMPLSGTLSGSLDCMPGPISGDGIMPLSGTPSGSLDRVKDKCDSVPGPNSGDGIMPLSGTPSGSLDYVPGPNSGDGIMSLRSGTPSGSLDRVKQRCDAAPGSTSGDGIMPLSGTPSGSLDRVQERCDAAPGPNSWNGTVQLYTRSSYHLDFLKPIYDRVPGPFSVENIIPQCGHMTKSTIVPFAKLLSHAVIKAPTGKTSISVSASYPKIKPELTPQTVDQVLTYDQTNQMTQTNSKPTRTQKVMSWLTWGVDILKDAMVI